MAGNNKYMEDVMKNKTNIDPTWLNLQLLKLISKLKTDQNRKIIEGKYKELGIEI
jgi:hypothetical protein